ncbi:hypothetical protein [Acidithiobacillus sp.]|uniref:hypothetical protein n=1 Tax=Acidithiobacillus sp. TaxID=1872118 RepID=UPI003CFD5D59
MDCNETPPWAIPHPMHYPISNEEMRTLLSAWPIKGEVVEKDSVYMPNIGQHVVLEIDEYGNIWDRMDCQNVPPKLPVSIKKLRAYLETLLEELGVAPERILEFERRYCDKTR